MSIKHINLTYSSHHEAATANVLCHLLCWVHKAHSPPSLLLKFNLHKKVFPDHPVLVTRPLLLQPTLYFSSQYPSLITSMLHILMFIIAPWQQGFSLLRCVPPTSRTAPGIWKTLYFIPTLQYMIHLQQGNKFFHHICLCIKFLPVWNTL